MKFNEPFDMNKADFDVFEQFAIGSRQSLFVRTKCGQLASFVRHPEPHRRRFHTQYNLMLWGTNDEWKGTVFPKPELTEPDGTPVKVSWLNGEGQQILWMDVDTGRCVAHGPYLSVRTYDIPDWAQGCYMYIAGYGRTIKGTPVQIIKSKKLDTEQERHRASIHMACRAFVEMQVAAGNLGIIKYNSSPVVYDPGMDFATMNGDLRAQIGKHGLVSGVLNYRVSHLVWTNNKPTP